MLSDQGTWKKKSAGPLLLLVLFSKSRAWWLMYKGSEMAQMQSSLVEHVPSHSVVSDSATLWTVGYGQIANKTKFGFNNVIFFLHILLSCFSLISEPRGPQIVFQITAHFLKALAKHLILY